MTDVLEPVLISYARFLEYRARRFGAVTELAQPDAGRTIDVEVCSAPAVNEEHARAAARVVATGSTDDLQGD